MKEEMKMRLLQKNVLHKLMRFQIVGFGGTLINLSCLWLLHGTLNINLLIAGAVSIELALIHNFTWHYFQTWKRRVKKTCPDYFLRLFKYNIITASIDFYLNLGILYLLVTFMELHYLAANLFAMSAGFLVKFAINETVIFKKELPLAESIHNQQS
jgi:putative flippase GtrA